jgi:hypothetical protein
MGAAIRSPLVGDSFRGTETAGLLASLPEPREPPYNCFSIMGCPKFDLGSFRMLVIIDP